MSDDKTTRENNKPNPPQPPAQPQQAPQANPSPSDNYYQPGGRDGKKGWEESKQDQPKKDK